MSKENRLGSKCANVHKTNKKIVEFNQRKNNFFLKQDLAKHEPMKGKENILMQMFHE
jgi:hypothetical protein